MKYIESLRDSLDRILSKSENHLLLGEDISDPYGGAFKVTKGLSTKYPDQIIHTPISESGFVGVATGMAYVGFKPIVEIMFCDFITVIVDIVINTASKLDWFSQGKMKGDLMIRTPAGGRRGYGPIHSQNLEKIFFGWPSISVISPNILNNPGELLENTYYSEGKLKFFIESKTDYSKKIVDATHLKNSGLKKKSINSQFPTTILYNNEDGVESDVVLCCYGGMVEHVMQAAYDLLIEEEITTKIYVPSLISPIDKSTIDSIGSVSSKIVIVEEGYSTMGWGTQLVGQLIESNTSNNRLKDIKIIGPSNKPIPANKTLENLHFPDSKKIVNEVRKIL